MKLLSDWGFNPESWRGQRGEYWFLLQVLLILGFVLLPVYRLAEFTLDPPGLYWFWGGAAVIGVLALIVLSKGSLDLGRNLTPLPYPKNDGQLVQTGIYGIVRHPLYSGLTLAAISWAMAQLSLSHLIAAIILFAFLNAKANREEDWLTEQFPEYTDYKKRVKKLIPWVY
jgi:protein-S-isoprenylcysteine O-methyltransferase Ste14